MNCPTPRPRTVLAMLAASLLLAGCLGEREVVIVGTRPGVPRHEYLAMPGSARLEQAKDVAPGGATQGVVVEVLLKTAELKGTTIPLIYTLHDADDGHPVISRKVPVTPDAEVWSRQGNVWLPILSPGSYYVQVALGDTITRKREPNRTGVFRIE